MPVEGDMSDGPASGVGRALPTIPESSDPRMTSTRRILFGTRSFYLDDSNGAAVAHRTLAAALARWGFAVEALCAATVDAGEGPDPAYRLAALGVPFVAAGGDAWAVGPAGIDATDPAQLRATVDAVPLTALRRPLKRLARPDPFEAAEFLRLFEATRRRFRPDVLVTYGGDPLTREVLARSRRAGIATVFALHNFLYTGRDSFVNFACLENPVRPVRHRPGRGEGHLVTMMARIERLELDQLARWPTPRSLLVDSPARGGHPRAARAQRRGPAPPIPGGFRRPAGRARARVEGRRA